MNELKAPTPIVSSALLAAIAEYFDWLTNAEIAAEEMGNVQYRDAMAIASSELGLILIKHKIYEPEQVANAKLTDASSDIEWFACRLYHGSNIGMGWVETMHWSISNEEFEKLGLTPDRQWTGKRWETLDDSEADAWRKLARLCLHALPHIAERIGHRFMEQSKAIRITNSSNSVDIRDSAKKDKPETPP